MRFSLLLALFLPTVALGQPQLFEENGHYYEVVRTAPDRLLSFEEARAEAAGRLYDGRQGHLITITSRAEDLFIQTVIESINPILRGQIYWTGGFQFDKSGGVNDGWGWITNEEWDYTNWGAGEPNDDRGREQDAMVYLANRGGFWGDGGSVRNSSTIGYLVEYPTPKTNDFVSEIVISPHDQSCNRSRKRPVGIEVAILGTAELDVSTIDFSTVDLDGLNIKGDGLDDGTCNVEYVNEDVYLDVTCLFDAGDIETELTAVTLNGDNVSASGSVCIK